MSFNGLRLLPDQMGSLSVGPLALLCLSPCPSPCATYQCSAYALDAVSLPVRLARLSQVPTP